MASISSHLHHKEYSIAFTNNKDLPIRKWDFERQSFSAPSPKSAAFEFLTKKGIKNDIVGTECPRNTDASYIYRGFVFILDNEDRVYVS